MAINIQNIIAALEAKVAAATNTTETQELIVLIKTIKASGQQTIATYATESALPTASQDNVGNIVYVTSLAKLQYSDGTAWASIGGGADLNAGAGISLTTEQDGSITITSQAQVGGDAVFDSALIGDVSIVGNEISAVDAYGNNSELLVNAPLTVQSDSLIEAVITTLVYGSAGYYQSSSSLITINSSDANEFISSLSPNEQFSFELISNSGYTFTGTANFNYSQVNYYGGTDIFVTNLISNSPNSNEFFSVNSKLFKGSTAQPLTVTASGVNVDGTFTVNGLPVAGGSGSSYDQDLNTTDDVVFNSALVGDVSIVGNEISGTDAYGNDATLVLNSPVDFKYTTTESSQVNLDFFNFFILVDGMDGIKLGNLSQSQIAAQALLDLPLGTAITTDGFYDQSSYNNIKLRFSIGSTGRSYDAYNPSVINSVNVYPTNNSYEYSTDNGANWIQRSIYGPGIYGSASYLALSYGGSTSIENTIASVTESGLNVNGTFTVNGQSIANYDQSLNTTDDVVFNSALIGDVSIVGNTIAAVDAYGLPDTLVVDGDLEITGELILPQNNATPGNTGSPVAWAKVSIAGQTYFMPLYQ